MKEKKYNKPKAEIIEFCDTDIIVTSDPYGNSGDVGEIGGGEVQ